jgi:hypothetical protein
MVWITDRSEFESGGCENCFLYKVETGSATHPASYPISSWTSFLGVKRVVTHLQLVYTLTNQYAFMA